MELLKYLESLPKNLRILDSTGTRKFHLFDSFEKVGEIYDVIFKSAKYSHRPSIVHRTTASERDNPKTLDEGEGEPTHIAFKPDGNDVLFILEERRVGISVNTLNYYLNKFAKECYDAMNRKWPYRIDTGVVTRGDFASELKKAARIQEAEVFVQKRYLADNFLGFSNRLGKVQDKMMVSFKAWPKENLKEVLGEIYNKSKKGSYGIFKIRAYGLAYDENPIMLDTEIMKTTDYIEAVTSPVTGVVDPDSIFTALNAILERD